MTSVLRSFSGSDREEIRIGVIALLTALVLASHQIVGNGIAGVIGSYAYWIVRVLIEGTLFVAALYVAERYIDDATSAFWLYVTAMLLSLVPFTLAITSFDLIVGLPELGIDPTIAASPMQDSSRLRAFALELLYLFDNHAALCGLLFLPRLLNRCRVQPNRLADAAPALSGSSETAKVEAGSAETDLPSTAPDIITPTLFESLVPPLEGKVIWVEAQEHYVRVTTADESRMVLHRFSDAIRELKPDTGMQVHRSHWVAFSAIEGIVKDGQTMKLRITGDATVPVSRSFRTVVEDRFADMKQIDS